MDNNKLNHYKQRLLKLKSDYEQLEHNIIDNSNLNISEREEYEELSFYDNHPADLGEETYLRELNYSRLDSVKNILNSINDALKRIDENSFGFCKTCGRVIEEERLEIMPYAAYCIKCEKKHEQLSAENTNFRPIEEKISLILLETQIWIIRTKT
jgi:Prokaryotic dksA/traR C4-type zinc finger.